MEYKSTVFTNGVIIAPLSLRVKIPFFLLSLMGVRITQSYWGENHGKGPADAVIGRVSQQIHSAIIGNKTSISHGMDMVLYLQSQTRN